MNGVAAEIAQKIGMFFEHIGFDARPSEQIAEHHARWSASSDTAARRHGLGRAFGQIGHGATSPVCSIGTSRPHLFYVEHDMTIEAGDWAVTEVS
jgi:hypothetical protein